MNDTKAKDNEFLSAMLDRKSDRSPRLTSSVSLPSSPRNLLIRTGFELDVNPPTTSPKTEGEEERPSLIPIGLTISPQNFSASDPQISFVKAQYDSPVSSHISDRSRHFHSRQVSRDIAALNFLQNIQMQSEHQILHGTREDHSKQSNSQAANDDANSHSLQGIKQLPSVSSKDNVLLPPESNEDPIAGRRLPGLEATEIGIPDAYRYRFTTKNPASSAVIRRWEQTVIDLGLLPSQGNGKEESARTYFSSGCGYPLAVSTVIKYSSTVDQNREGKKDSGRGGNNALRKRQRLSSNGNLHGLAIPAVDHNERETPRYDWRGKSYFHLLHSTWAACDADRDTQDEHPTYTPYQPKYLDGPEFRQGKHRHVVRGDKTIGPVISSILLFVKPKDLKEELNKKFAEKHVALADSNLSLSKIRNLKREVLECCRQLHIEIATAALACVYFEKLVLSNYVNKLNRKLYMSVSFLLAAKFNEPRASDDMAALVQKFLIEIDRIHGIPSREVLTMEFTIYAQLSFGLHVPLKELQPHFTRLLKYTESNPRKYLDDDIFAIYSDLLIQEKNELDQIDILNTDRSYDGDETHDEGTDASDGFIESGSYDIDDDDGDDLSTENERTRISSDEASNNMTVLNNSLSRPWSQMRQWLLREGRATLDFDWRSKVPGVMIAPNVQSSDQITYNNQTDSVNNTEQTSNDHNDSHKFEPK